MSKKLVTSVEKFAKCLLKQEDAKGVENALKDGTPCIVFKANDEKIVIAVTNKNGQKLIDAASAAGITPDIPIGVLRGHSEYCVPNKLMTELALRSKS